MTSSSCCQYMRNMEQLSSHWLSGSQEMIAVDTKSVLSLLPGILCSAVAHELKQTGRCPRNIGLLTDHWRKCEDAGRSLLHHLQGCCCSCSCSCALHPVDDFWNFSGTLSLSESRCCSHSMLSMFRLSVPSYVLASASARSPFAHLTSRS